MSGIPLYVPVNKGNSFKKGKKEGKKGREKREGKKGKYKRNVTYLLEIKIKYNKSYSVTRISELGLDCTKKQRRGKKGRKIVLNPKFRRPNIVLYFTARSSELRVTE